MRTTYLILAVVHEDDPPTRPDSRDATIDTTAEELTSHTRIPTAMLPPPLQALSAWIKRPMARGAR